MARRSVVTLCVVLLVFVLGSCRREDNSIPPVEEQDRIIATATQLDEPSKIKLTWFPVECEVFNGVEVDSDEMFVNIRIRVTVNITDCPPGGFSETVVDIGEPLGERQIWDRAFGDTVALTP